ncbi:hypothetical protein ISG33_14390 [Glaciecola sp. MH2013]|uniref:hypothetical protein n=1 Tax=Glaciecola sp. MH2013 TaxID=2785524 RepID=UPI00189EAC79|nr:hypothetical protein [Glaciecola sp. MH2013]MBF7074591.1 hypothetical protein [Glaciecola sp. MH2013]
MEGTHKFNRGDWLVNEDGICQVLGAQDYVVEQFFAYEFSDKKLGDVYDRKLVCKQLCGFEPKPRKARFIKVYSSIYCEPINDEYLALMQLIKVKFPDQFKKFETIKLKKPLYAGLDFSLRVNPDKKEDIVAGIDDLLSNNIKSMDFDTVENMLFENIDGIETARLANQHIDRLCTNVLVTLYYDVLGACNNTYCFSYGTARSVYCAQE